MLSIYNVNNSSTKLWLNSSCSSSKLPSKPSSRLSKRSRVTCSSPLKKNRRKASKGTTQGLRLRV